MQNEKLDQQLKLEEELKKAIEKKSDAETIGKIYDRYHKFILSDGIPAENRKNDGFLYAPSKYKNPVEQIIFNLVPEKIKVLEIGFGDGRLAHSLVKNKNCLVSAIDVSGLAVEMAKKNFQLSDALDYIRADARKIPFDNEYFDIAVSKDLIEHLPEKDHKSHFREVKRVLKNNGLYLFFTPPKIIPRKSRGLHLKEYGLKELLRELKNCGFKNEKIYLAQAMLLGIITPLPEFLIKTISAYEALMEKTKINKLLIFGGMHKALLPRYVISVQK